MSINTDEIMNSINAYWENMRILNAYSKEINELEAYDEWTEKYKELCASQYSYALENDSYLESLEPLWGRTLRDDDLANRLYEFVKDVDDMDIYDSGLLVRVLDKLIPYFTEKDDKSKLVVLYRLAIVVSYINAWYLGKKQYYENYVDKLLDLTKQFGEIESKKAREYMIRVWYSYIVVEYNDGFYDSVAEMYRRYDQFLDFLEANKLNDADDAIVDYEKKHIKQRMMGIERHLGLVEDPDLIERFTEMANENYLLELDEKEEEWEIEPVVYAAKLHTMQKSGLFSKEDICDTMLSFYRQILANCGEIESKDERARKAVSAQWILFHWLTDEFSDAESLTDGYRKYAMHELIECSDVLYTQKLKDYFIPLSSSVESWCEAVLPYVTSDHEKNRLLKNYAFKYQKNTYSHCLNIAEISKLIAQKLVEQKSGIIEKCVSYIEGDFVEGIYQAAFLHDVGKMRIRQLANLLGRSYSNEEREALHNHTLMGAHILYSWDNPGLLINVSQGHHKSYDEMSGYPENISTEGSPYKIAVDIVHIADAIETASMIFGKKDAVAKPFDSIMRELRLGGGTQYNPDIVGLIVNSPELMKQIRHIVVYARCEKIYKVYQG